MIPMEMKVNMFEVFKSIKAQLDSSNIYYDTRAYRDDAFSFLVHVPGEYWEIDVREDGSVDVEVFKSEGMRDDPWAAIEQLVDDHRD